MVYCFITIRWKGPTLYIAFPDLWWSFKSLSKIVALIWRQFSFKKQDVCCIYFACLWILRIENWAHFNFERNLLDCCWSLGPILCSIDTIETDRMILKNSKYISVNQPNKDDNNCYLLFTKVTTFVQSTTAILHSFQKVFGSYCYSTLINLHKLPIICSTCTVWEGGRAEDDQLFSMISKYADF